VHGYVRGGRKTTLIIIKYRSSDNKTDSGRRGKFFRYSVATTRTTPYDTYVAKRILLIDDDAYIRDLYEEVFTDAGFVVTVADNGQTGLEELMRGGYDAVLMDVMMPKLDGIGVLSKLKETPPSTPNGPILLLTNLDRDPMLERAQELGAYAHVLKADILPPALVDKVNEAIKSTASGTPPPVQ
jgi:two-component system chemotaxis response regulator CheY